MQCCASSIVSYFDIEDDDNENNDEIGNTLLVDFMICLYQAGSQSEGERIRGRGTYLGENLDPRVIMYDHVMVGIEWKRSFRIGDNPQNKMIFFLFVLQAVFSV